MSRDITWVNIGLKFCQKMEIKIDETYHVASCCYPQYVHEVLGKIVFFTFPS